MLVKDSITVGKYRVHNRMVKAPIWSDSCQNGYITQKTIDHYTSRAQGGRFGLYVVEHSYVRSDGIASPSQLSSSRDSDIKGLKQLADILHDHGSLAILQLNHAGCGAFRSWTGQDAVSASDISVSCGIPTSEPNPEPPKPLSINEIKDLQTYYIRAAQRAMDAGYDGINLHSAHSYLLNQFYSPITNKRIDAYNGYTLEGRTRFHMELIQELRKVIGDKIFMLRLGGCDYRNGGSTIEDAVEASKRFEQAGIDLIDISGGYTCFLRPGHTYPGYFADTAQAVKNAVNIPVLLTGGVKTVADAELLLQEGMADMIGVGRAITANADWGMELAKS